MLKTLAAGTNNFLFTVVQVEMVLDWFLVSASNESDLKKLKT